MHEGGEDGGEALQVVRSANSQALPTVNEHCEVAHHPAIHWKVPLATLCVHVQRPSA